VASLNIDIHMTGNREDAAITSLRSNRIDPKLHYVTPRQSDLWRQVFLRHSPIRANPEFARIYRDAFAQVSETLPKELALIGLGCGTGMKELELFQQLKSRDIRVHFSAVDVSRDLVVESAQKLAAAGALHGKNLVCDLSYIKALVDWLDQNGSHPPRVFTFFGLVPNFSPSLVTRLFRAILRPGDVLLVSAHLAPVGDGIDLPAAMRSILPQYDNPETLAWLSAILEEWGIDHLLEPPEMTVGEIEKIPAFIAKAAWKSDAPFEKWGQCFTPKTENPLQLFHSLRYTPELFEHLLRNETFTVERLAMTTCREEAIWSVRR
jgi:L-histidine Nalpha-methyltransferase